MLKPLNEQAMYLENLSDDEIDYSDIPPLTEEQIAQVQRGKFYRPQAVAEFYENLESVQVDAEVKAWFVEHGVSINQVLKQYILQHSA